MTERALWVFSALIWLHAALDAVLMIAAPRLWLRLPLSLRVRWRLRAADGSRPYVHVRIYGAILLAAVSAAARALAHAAP